MAKVTMELRTFLSSGYELFDFPYPFDDKDFARELERSVIDYYLFCEIGQEIPERFKHVFRTNWLSMIDYYNKLHNTTLLEYNPLINYTMTEALEQLGSSSSNLDNTESSSSDGSISNTGENTLVEHQENTANATTNTNTEDNTNTDNIGTNKSDSTGTTKTEGTTESTGTRTDNLQTTTSGSNKESDYPQQSIAGGDYLSGAVTSEGSTGNTGTVKNVDNGKRIDKTDNTTTTVGDTTNKIRTDGTTTSLATTTSEDKKDADTLSTSQDNTTTADTLDKQGNTKTTGTNRLDYKKTVEGLTGKSYQELMALERDSIMRIRRMVISELKSCFLLVY